MSDQDFAIVIGIQRYPTLAPPHPPGSPHDLQGANFDAKAVYDWLGEPNGGNVPEEQRLLVTSALYPDPFQQRLGSPTPQLDARPNSQDLGGCFGWLFEERQNRGTMRLGRRLYVYFSGHGFAVGDCDGGVYTADASIAQHHFYVRNWFDWFYRNRFFEEYVLWADACADPISIHGAPQAAPYPDRQVAGLAAGRRFVAFAAKHTLRSVERMMPDGNIRGVFTYSLLEALRGAAADRQTGEVTSVTLRENLPVLQMGNLPQQDLDNVDVDNHPSFGPTEDMVFCTPVAVTKFERTIRFNARHEGKTASLLDGSFSEIDSLVVDGNPWTVSLPLGLYSVEVGADASEVIKVKGRSTDDIIVA